MAEILFDDLPMLERSSGSPQGSDGGSAGSIASELDEADSIDNTTFNKSRKENIVSGSDDEDDDTYDGMELDFDDASTIATTFTCLQHQYQQQKHVKLEGVLEKLGVKADADDDEKTKAWEKLSKDELLQLLAALRVDLGAPDDKKKGDAESKPKKSSMKNGNSTTTKQSANIVLEPNAVFEVPVPPWSGGIIEEGEEDLKSKGSEYDVQVKIDDDGNEEYSVKLPPWAAKKKQDSVTPRSAGSKGSVSGNSRASRDSKRSRGSKGSKGSSVLDSAGPMTRQWFREHSTRNVNVSGTSTASPVSVNEELPEEHPAEDDDIFSVKLPPWLEKKEKQAQAQAQSASEELKVTPTRATAAPAPVPRRRVSAPAVPTQTQVKPKPARPQQTRALHSRTSIPAPAHDKKAVNFSNTAPPARPSLKASKKPPSFRNLFGGKDAKSSSRKLSKSTAKVSIPVVQKNIQSIIHSSVSKGKRRKEGAFLAADIADTQQSRLAMINANWNSHYTAAKKKNSPAAGRANRETNARHVRSVPLDTDSLNGNGGKRNITTTVSSPPSTRRNSGGPIHSSSTSAGAAMDHSGRSGTSSTVRSNTSRSLQSGTSRSFKGGSVKSDSTRSTMAEC